MKINPEKFKCTCNKYTPREIKAFVGGYTTVCGSCGRYPPEPLKEINMKNLKTKPAKFESHREFAQAMLDGRKFNLGGGKMYYDEALGFTYECEGSVEPLEEAWDSWLNRQLEEIIETPWYEELENYPNGVLCWVSDYKNNKSLVEVVTRRATNTSFETYSEYWMYATPVTMEEIQHLIYKQEK